MNNYDYNSFHSPGPGPHSPGPRPPQDNDPISTIAWVIDIGLIFAWFPIGLFLTIANAAGHDFVGNLIRSFTGKGQKRPQRDSAKNTRADSAQYSRPSERDAQRARTASARTGVPPAQPKTEAEAKDAVRHADAGAKLREVFGWILAAFGLAAAAGTILSAGTIWSVLTYIAMALGGGILVFSGRQAKKKEAAFRRCMTVSGNKGIVRMKPLAKTLGMTVEELEKQLSDMIDRGYYGERAYIDHARELLVIEPEHMRDVYRAEDEAKAKQAEQQERESQTEYERYIERIRQADIDIDDEVMSEKIRRMQSITAAIFKEVEEHPEKRAQIDRFMNYYLPTTLKLLESYARIEEQGVSGENTAKAKADIERIADTLVEGYRKQLDTLYRAEAVDIAGDVGVIESMMRRDGLTGQSDFRPFRKFVEKEETTADDAGGEVMGGH